MTALYLLEPPAGAASWAPFAGSRPVSELRAGVPLLRERWERALGLTASGIISDHLSDSHEPGVPVVVRPTEVRGPAIVAAAWAAVSEARVALAPGAGRLVAGDRAIGWVLGAGESWTGMHERGTAQPVTAMVLDGAFALLNALDELLLADCRALAAGGGDPLPEGSIVLGDAGVRSRGATIEPGVVFDVRKGPVVLEPGVEVRHGTRLEGPCYVGEHTRVLGGFIRNSVFGPHCVVRGEIASSSFVGYANKGHDGFIGNSVIGHWVNLGAGTTTSNLKNTYGPVRLDVAGARIETGRLNVGSLIGDHAKTAIGTMLATGTVIGAGASVFGPAAPPKYVPAFAWGSDGASVMSEEGFLRIAARVMPRRGVTLTDQRAESLRATYRRLAGAP